jgi:hypothetical protein
MSTEFLLALRGLLGALIPVLALSVVGLLTLSRSRLGDAVARWIAGDARHPDHEAQLDGLHEEVAALKAQLADTQERVEFSERLLARADPRPREIDPG